MRPFAVFFLVAALAVHLSPLARAQAAQAPGTQSAASRAATPSRQLVVGISVVSADEAGRISGTVVAPDGAPLANTLVQARSLATREFDGSTRTGTRGEFTILDLEPGNYVLETLQGFCGQSARGFGGTNIAGTAATAASRQAALGASEVSAGTAGISGTVISPEGAPLANTWVQARNLLTNEIDGSTRSSASGEYTIQVTPGNYVLEILDDDCAIMATSSFISATTGGIVGAVTIAATSGAVSAVTTTTNLVAALGATAARGVSAAAAAAGVAGVVVPPAIPTASPSR